MQVSALTASTEHLYCGTFCGKLFKWSLQSIKSELQVPILSQNDDNVEMTSADQVAVLGAEQIKSQFTCIYHLHHKGQLYIAHKNGLSTYTTKVQHILQTLVIQFDFLNNILVALSQRQVTAVHNENRMELDLASNATCVTKVSSTMFAIGFENSQIILYNIDTEITVCFQLDHKLTAIKGIAFFGNYLIAAVNGVGVFKWLYMPNSLTNNSQASLVKIMPVTRGFQINAMIHQDNELLVGTSDSFLLKYESTLGYSGYYQSAQVTEVYALCEVSPGVCAVGGKGSCIEVVQLKSNALLIKLTF